MFKNKTILITEAIFFGQKFIDICLNRFNPKKIIIYSRDELNNLKWAINLEQVKILKN